MAENYSSLKIIEVQGSDSTLWDNFVKKSPQGNFFHSMTWANIISNTFSRKFKTLICVRNEQPVGGMIFFEHKKLIWRMITPTPLFPYTAPFYYQPTDEKYQKTIHMQLNISAAFEEYLHRNYDYWILDSPANSKDMRAYLWQGAVVEPKYSYVVTLDKKENLINNFNQNLRKKLKQAAKQGAVVKESEDWPLIVDLIIKSYHRHGIRPNFPISTLQTFLEMALNYSQVKLFLIELDIKLLAARLVIIDEETIFDLLAGSADESGAGSAYLVNQIMMQYVDSHKYFDFMGADHPQIEQFKRGFGGELVQGFRITNKVKKPLSWFIKTHRYRLRKDRIL
jgi:lipid II:glycine glycyltransferase (peptidoglycan interpeptide bridge formation enzyme)